MRDIPGFSDGQKRVVALTLGDRRVISVYVPNGQEVGSDKYAYKLAWFGALAQWLRAELARWPRLALAGDFNVAPEDSDVWDPERWRGQFLFSDPEKEALASLTGWGLEDTVRRLRPESGVYTWWDYRFGAFHRRWGLRIDHVLATPPIPTGDEHIPGSVFTNQPSGMPAAGGISQLPVQSISPNPRQPRNTLQPEELAELTEPVREHGVLQPLIVTPGDRDGRYILIAGERRLQASRLAGLTSVPVIVRQASSSRHLKSRSCTL